jgi:hypothetical protein
MSEENKVRESNEELTKKLKKCKKISRAKDVGLFSIIVFAVAMWFGTGMISNDAANQKMIDTMKQIKVEKK